MPCETTMAVCSLIFGGVLERLPKLKICLAHGGGSFPATIGRIEHGFLTRPDLCAINTKVPPSYVSRTGVTGSGGGPGRFLQERLPHPPRTPSCTLPSPVPRPAPHPAHAHVRTHARTRAPRSRVALHRAYLGRIWVDSLVHDLDALDLLIKKMGEDRVVLGSDYPFILGEHRPGELVVGAPALTDAVKRKILVDNALKMFGLTREQFQP